MCQPNEPPSLSQPPLGAYIIGVGRCSDLGGGGGDIFFKQQKCNYNTTILCTMKFIMQTVGKVGGGGGESPPLPTPMYMYTSTRTT